MTAREAMAAALRPVPGEPKVTERWATHLRQVTRRDYREPTADDVLAALDAAGWAVVPKPKRDQGEIVWKGKPASTLTREELMEALGIATDEMERQCDNYLHVRRLLTERGL